MIIQKTMSDGWLSNTWLVGDRPGGHAVVIDTGGPMEPIVQRIEAERLTLTHILCTHHHIDHVSHNADYKSRFGCPICGHTEESGMFGDLDVQLKDGDEVKTGDLHIRAIHVPGHTLGQLSFLVNEERVFTGDTLFVGKVGGTGLGADARQEYDSLHDKLMTLPGHTRVFPGHDYGTAPESTIDNERIDAE